MRVLVTGAAGMLGTDVCLALKDKHKVIATDVVGDTVPMDITDTAGTRAVIVEHKPEVIVHCAAYTNVDGCETQELEAFRLNALGTWNVASVARDIGASMVYISTDFVFDGTKGEPYTEYDVPNPLSCYGESKRAGEIHVQTLCPKHFIVRTAWLYGNRGKNFPTTILNRAEAGQPTSVVADQFGSPTYTPDLAAFIAELIETSLYGIYHATNKGSCSWYEFARKALDLAGMSDFKLKPIRSVDWPSPTRRPMDSRLRHFALELLGKDTFRPWEDALAEFVEKWITAKQ